MVDVINKYFDICDEVYDNWKLANQTYYTTYVKPFLKQVYNLSFFIIIVKQIAGNEHWEVSYEEAQKCYFLYDLKSDDSLVITNPDLLSDVVDMMQAHFDGNLIE